MKPTTRMVVSLVVLSAFVNGLVFYRAMKRANTGHEPIATPAAGTEPATTSAPIPPASPSSGSRGMTWGVETSYAAPNGDVLVACEASVATSSGSRRCDAYAGDTPCGEALPILCLRPDGAPDPTPPMERPDGGRRDFYTGWSSARLALSEPVPGHRLASADAGDAVCRSAAGSGFRMAEFHDGGGGWGLRGIGRVPSTTRFWVRNNDQPANCWNRRGDDTSVPQR